MANNVSLIDKNCTGCSACQNGCPYNAIELRLDMYGFFAPHVTDACINCGKCAVICPAINSVESRATCEPISYAMVNSNLDEIEKSSSGGIFFLLAKHVICDLGGVVFGAAYREDFSVEIVAAETMTDLNRLVGSKYVQSLVGNSYKIAEGELQQGRVVLFSGVSCQIAGLYSYLDKHYPNLITIEVLCHGAPSPGLFGKYVEHIEHKYKKKLTTINQRDKSTPWNPLITKRVRLTFEDGTEVMHSEDFDPYMSLYVREIAYRDACYQCQYVGTKHNGDIVLGDFGGLGLAKPCTLNVRKGVSLVLVCSEAGKQLVDAVGDAMCSEQRDLSEVTLFNSCLRSNVKPPAKRGSFLRDYTQLSGDALFRKYYYRNFSYLIRAMLKRAFIAVAGSSNVAKLSYKIRTMRTKASDAHDAHNT